MASESSSDMFSEIDYILECPKCKTSPKEPKLLPCLHIYCRPCLDQMLRQSAHPGELSCPSCQAQVPLPSGQVTDLPDAPLITSMVEAVAKLKHLGLHQSPKCNVCSKIDVVVDAHSICVDCMNTLCETCLPKHNTFVRNINIGKQVLPCSNLQLDSMLQNRTPTCPEHGEVLSYYCAKCQKLICLVCEEEHYDHAMQTIKFAVDQQKQALKKCLEKIHHQELLYDEKIRDANAARNTCLDQGDFTKSQIKDHGDKIIDQIQQNVKSLHEIIDEETAKLVSDINSLKETLQLENSRLKDAARFISTSLKFGNASDVIEVSDKIQAFERLLVYPQASHAIPSLDVELQLVDIDTFKPQNTIGLLHYKAKCGSLVSTLVSKYRCNFDPSDVDCTREKNNIVVCQYFSDRAEMHNAEDTKTVNFRVPGGTKARGIACTERQVYMTDCANGSVLVFDHQGEHIKSIPVGIKGVGFIAICGKTAYVTSQDDHRVYRLQLQDGHYQNVFLQQSDGIETPFGVAASHTRVAVTSKFKHSLHVFNTAGRLQFVYGGPEQLNSPHGVALDLSGRVLVADHWNGRVVLLSPVGQNLGYIPMTTDQLSRPQGLSINSKGQVIIGCYCPKSIATYQYKFE